MKQISLIFIALGVVGCASAPRIIFWDNQTYTNPEIRNQSLNLAVNTCSTLAQALNPALNNTYMPVPSNSGFARGYANGANAAASGLAAGHRSAIRKDFEKCMIEQGWKPVFEQK